MNFSITNKHHLFFSSIFRPLLEPGLLRSYHGGLPQQVQQSPANQINTICEENETMKSSVDKFYAYFCIYYDILLYLEKIKSFPCSNKYIFDLIKSNE